MKYLYLLLLTSLLYAESFTVPAKQPHLIYSAEAPSGNTEHLITYSKGKSTLEAFKIDFKNEQALKTGQTKLEVAPQHILALDDKILITTGRTLKQQNRPVEVSLYNHDLSEKTVIYSVKSDRAEVTSLKHKDGGVLITYYDSTYFTVTGLLTKNVENKWDFKKLFRVRMASTTDTINGTFLVARGYGDKIGEVGDATVVIAGKEVKLPTHNGVSSGCLAQLDEDPELEVILGDGWHMNYGKFAEPRVTLFNYDSEKGAYSPRVLTNEKIGKQYRLDKISVSNTGIILAVGAEKSYFINSQADWGITVTPSNRIVDLGQNYYAYILGTVKVEKIDFPTHKE